MDPGDEWNYWKIESFIGEGRFSKCFWVGGGALGENFSVTNMTKMLNSCEFREQ